MSTIKGSVSGQLSTASCACGGAVCIESKHVEGVGTALGGQRVSIWCVYCEAKVCSPLLAPRRAINNATQAWAVLQKLTGEASHV